VTCLEIAGSSGIRSRATMFFSDHLVSKGAWRRSVICCHHGARLTVHGEVRGENWRVTWKTGFWWLATVVQGFVVLVAAALASESDNRGEVQSPTLEGENSRSGLNLLCLTMILLKTLFCQREFSPRWKPMIYDWGTITLVHYFLPGDVAIGEAELRVLSWWCLYFCYKK
jgi:hypothetical protein